MTHPTHDAAHPASKPFSFHRQLRATHHGKLACRLVMFVCWCVVLGGVAALAQNVEHAQNAVDYRLRTSAGVDSATLGMQLQIPLGNYGGRGGVDMPITLYYSSKLWRVQQIGQTINCGATPNTPGEPHSTYKAFYAESSASGWTSNLDWFKWPVETGQTNHGVNVKLQFFDDGGRPCNQPGCAWTAARIYVTLPDGSKHELRKDDEPHAFNGYSHSGTFYAVDSSRLRYEIESGTLFMPDGARYVLNGAGPIQYIDRNGNTLTYDDANNRWSDTLGRHFSLPPLNTSEATTYFYTLPGVGTSSLTYKFVWKRLEDALTNPSDELHYRGDRQTGGCGTSLAASPSLFVSPADDEGGPGVHRLLGNEGLHNPVVLAQIELPNGRAYTFTYNVYGEIDKVVFPTGAFESFTYDEVANLSGQFGESSSLYAQTNRGVTHRAVSFDGTVAAASQRQWVYGTGIDTSSIPYRLTRLMTMPDNTQMEVLYHTGRSATEVKFGFEDVRAGMPMDERVISKPDAQGARHLLRRTLTKYVMISVGNNARGYTATRDARASKRVEIFFDTLGSDALAKVTTYEYDFNPDPATTAHMNLKTAQHYDLAPIAKNNAASLMVDSIDTVTPGALLRTEEMDYLYAPAYSQRNLVTLPTAMRVRGLPGSPSALVSETSFTYDEYALAPVGDPVALTGWTDPGAAARGNATTVRRSKNAAGDLLIVTHAKYDVAGNTIEATNARDFTSLIEYSPAFKYAYATKTLTPVPDPSGMKGSQARLTGMSNYDLNTGLVLSNTDANGNTTSFDYSDSLNRLKTVTRPTGGGSTTYEYGDVPGNLFVKSLTDLDATRKVETQQFFDGLGRATRSYLREGDALYTATVTEHDNMDRVHQVSNPLRTASVADALSPTEWTTTEYDSLGRAVSMQTPDNASVTTAYDGNKTTVTDQADKSRRSETDALGRLTGIVEDPAGAAYPTAYEYDALGSLRKVTQQSAEAMQTRSFTYDLLSRLTSVSNPESGTMFYSYDDTGNLLQRTDARAVRTDYSYDALNRDTSRSYIYAGEGEPPANFVATPTVHYFYDGKGMPAEVPVPPFSLGQLTAVKSSVSETISTEFDAVGRTRKNRQVTGGVAYPMEYDYDFAGNVIAQKYPSGRVVKSSYDAAGRIGEVFIDGPTPKSYAANFAYTPHGAVGSLRLGNQLWEHTAFNNRLQPTEIGLGTTSTDASKLKLEYGYGGRDGGGTLNAQKNNGNVESQLITVAAAGSAPALSFTQSYTYDAVNRLKTAEEASGTTPVWKQVYDYDRSGNRTLSPATTLPAMLDARTNPQINPATNRIADGQGYGYDAAGNVVATPDAGSGTHSYDYDGENRQVRYDGGASSTGGATYSYDGDGRRVKKEVGVTQTVFVYNIAGQLVAEYDTEGASGTGTSYLTQDTLGSVRVVTGADRAAKERRDYLPFGEEVSLGGRVDVPGYTSEAVRQKFTSNERDDETGLDYMKARYYASPQGRFTSPDPYGPWAMSEDKKVAFLGDPQQWNRYSYVTNNPQKYTDPDGLERYAANVSEERQKQIRQALEEVANNGTRRQRMIANFILKSDVVIYLFKGGDDGLTGVTDRNAANSAIASGFKNVREAGQFVQIGINEYNLGTSPDRAAALEGTLVHEGDHAFGLATTISELSSRTGTFYNPTLHQSEYDAFVSEANYYLKRGRTNPVYNEVGLGGRGSQWETVLQESNGKFKVNEAKINETLLRGYGVTRENPGRTSAERRRLVQPPRER